MTIEIKSPAFPESVADGSIATWHKQLGEPVFRDDLIVDIETDKVVLEVVAPGNGVLKEIKKAEGDIVLSEEVIALFEEGAVADKSQTVVSSAEQSAVQSGAKTNGDKGGAHAGPAARKMMAENDLSTADVTGSGRGGLITKQDVNNCLSSATVAQSSALAQTELTVLNEAVGERIEKRVPMSRIRAMVADRLLGASQNTAMLTTFNEVNMKPVMDIRQKYKDTFEKKHQTRLGFMSFFVRATSEALKRFPDVNASIDGNDIVYHGYYDVGVAVSSPRGLVVPVLRNADQMSLAKIEMQIRDFGVRARDGKLGIEEMQGGTFTISNGGVFGSLLSTPILNPPQTAILGMHKIQERVMAINGEVVVLPMMYLALSYDHRMIDGKEAVSFLLTIKELLEDPSRILLEI